MRVKRCWTVELAFFMSEIDESKIKIHLRIVKCRQCIRTRTAKKRTWIQIIILINQLKDELS